MIKELVFPKTHEPWALVSITPQVTSLDRTPPLPCVLRPKKNVITFPVSGLRIQVETVRKIIF